MNSSDLVMPTLLKVKSLVLVLITSFKTELVFLAVHQKYLVTTGKSLFLKSSETFAKILI